MGHRIRTAFAAASILLVVAGLSLMFAGAAHAHRAGARHQWKVHLHEHAKEDVAAKAGLKRIGARVRAIEDAQDDDTGDPGDDGQGTATPAPAGGGPNDDDSIGNALFGWADGGGFGSNWPEGLGIAALGAIGALATAFFYLNETLPSVGGTALMKALRAEIDEFKGKQRKVLAEREGLLVGTTGDVPVPRVEALARLAHDYEKGITVREDRLTAERRASYRTGMPMYVVLGGAFAVLFATNALQALLVGFGWTAVANRAGLKRDVEATSSEKDRRIEEMEEVATEKVEAAVAAPAATKETVEAQRVAVAQIKTAARRARAL